MSFYELSYLIFFDEKIFTGFIKSLPMFVLTKLLNWYYTLIIICLTTKHYFVYNSIVLEIQFKRIVLITQALSNRT